MPKHTNNYAIVTESARDISIWLDDYDDIFSDFDSRTYHDRVISDDFITELSKVCRESELAVNELKLLLPERSRNRETETIITKRLHSFFRINFQKQSLAKRKTVLKGGILLCIGVILMLTSSYIGMRKSETLGLNLLFVILEPAGWFTVWTSFEELFSLFKNKIPELEFYSKMVKSRVTFVSIR